MSEKVRREMVVMCVLASVDWEYLDLKQQAQRILQHLDQSENYIKNGYEEPGAPKHPRR